MFILTPHRQLTAAGLLALAGCDGPNNAPDPAEERRPPAIASASPAPAAAVATAQWDLRREGPLTTLLLHGKDGASILALSCPVGAARLRIEIAGFSLIGSEDRLSFGSDGMVEALAAQLHGDGKQSGVSAEGPVPGNLRALIGGPLAASYGAQTSGPHPAPPAALADAFVEACAAAARQQPAAAPNPCLLQHGQRLAVAPTRAIGTEPFWGARIEGRCVTYSHPENPQGTRIWARYTATTDGQAWIGALDGQPFELRLRSKTACSDGMSDKTYPMGAELLVHGERRQGCADPL